MDRKDIIITTLLVGILVIFIFYYATYKAYDQKIKEMEIENNSTFQLYAGYMEEYNQLAEEYNNLIIDTNTDSPETKKLTRVIEALEKEVEMWGKRYEYEYNRLQLCNNHKTYVPKKPLKTVNICPKCRYHLVCNDSFSMLPFFDCDDNVTIYTNIERSEIDICDIIAFKTPDYPSRAFVIHQIASRNGTGYKTRGMANHDDDGYIVQFNDIIGRFIGVEQR